MEPTEEEIDLYYKTKRDSMQHGSEPHCILFLTELRKLDERKKKDKERAYYQQLAHKEVHEKYYTCIFD